MSKYGVFSGPYFPIFGMNTEIYGETGKDGPEKTPHLDIFYVVNRLILEYYRRDCS